ncbi:HNH endonuclease [Bacteroides oleiciplenus]
MPRSKYNLTRTSLIDKLQARKCKYCGITKDLKIYHVHKLKNLKGKLT